MTWRKFILHALLAATGQTLLLWWCGARNPLIFLAGGAFIAVCVPLRGGNPRLPPVVRHYRTLRAARAALDCLPETIDPDPRRYRD